MRAPLAVFVAVALGAVMATPAAAEHRSGHRYCESARAGPHTAHGQYYRELHTYNLSCRKGLAVMRAFARRHGAPPALGDYSDRFKGFRCRASFGWHPEGVIYGTVTCRKGTRKVDWFGAGPGSPGGGAPD